MCPAIDGQIAITIAKLKTISGLSHIDDEAMSSPFKGGIS